MPSYRHRVPAGTGLVVGPGRRRQPSTCWINTGHLPGPVFVEADHRYGDHQRDRDDRLT